MEGHQRERHDPEAGSRRAPIVDPFSATPMLILFCNVVEPSTGELYGRDPRSTATRAEAYLKATRHRRHRVRRPGSRILHVRRRPVRGRLHRERLSRSTISSCRPTRRANMTAATSPTVRAPRAATSPSLRSTAPWTSAARWSSTMLEMGLPMRQASPRGRRRPARARPDLRQAGRDRRPHADLQICRAHGRPGLRQDRDLHAQADRQG